MVGWDGTTPAAGRLLARRMATVQLAEHLPTPPHHPTYHCYFQGGGDVPFTSFLLLPSLLPCAYALFSCLSLTQGKAPPMHLVLTAHAGHASPSAFIFACMTSCISALHYHSICAMDGSLFAWHRLNLHFIATSPSGGDRLLAFRCSGKHATSYPPPRSLLHQH